VSGLTELVNSALENTSALMTTADEKLMEVVLNIHKTHLNDRNI